MSVIPAFGRWKRVGKSPELRSSRPAWATWQNPISTEKLCQAQWHVPIVPATQEAEARDSLDPGR